LFCSSENGHGRENGISEEREKSCPLFCVRDLLLLEGLGYLGMVLGMARKREIGPLFRN